MESHSIKENSAQFAHRFDSYKRNIHDWKADYRKKCLESWRSVRRNGFDQRRNLKQSETEASSFQPNDTDTEPIAISASSDMFSRSPHASSIAVSGSPLAPNLLLNRSFSADLSRSPITCSISSSAISALALVSPLTSARRVLPFNARSSESVSLIEAIMRDELLAICPDSGLASSSRTPSAQNISFPTSEQSSNESDEELMELLESICSELLAEDAAWSRAEADIYSASYEHDSLEPMATVESRSSELMSSGEVDMEDVGADAQVSLPCPICRANELQVYSTAVCCACGLTLPSHGISAAQVRATISAAVEHHSIGCHMQPHFLAPPEQLLLQCSSCEILIPILF